MNYEKYLRTMIGNETRGGKPEGPSERRSAEIQVLKV